MTVYIKIWKPNTLSTKEEDFMINTLKNRNKIRVLLDEIMKMESYKLKIESYPFRMHPHLLRFISEFVLKSINTQYFEYNMNITNEIKEDNEEKKELNPNKNENDDEFMVECQVNDTDHRQQIYESSHKNDDITHCIGLLRILFYDPSKNPLEECIGTGTVIYVDDDNNCYVLTAAHNFAKNWYKCTNCKKSTLKPTCKHCNMKTQKQSDLLQASTIEFKRRCIVKKKNKENGEVLEFGDNEQTYEINVDKCWIMKEYKNLALTTNGYDICIMQFHDKDGYYKDKVKNIYLTNDVIGMNNCSLSIYGFPGDKAGVYNYEMWGMSTSKNNVFALALNKRLIINKEIDTQPGESGSCVFNANNAYGTYMVYGVHVGGHKTKRQNYGTVLHLDWIKKQFERNGIDIKKQIIEVASMETKTGIIQNQDVYSAIWGYEHILLMFLKILGKLEDVEKIMDINNEWKGHDFKSCLQNIMQKLGKVSKNNNSNHFKKLVEFVANLQ
eukprot:99994_1